MSYKLEIRPLAFADIAQAAEWYENRQPGLGQKFIQEVVSAIESLRPNPLIYRLRHRRLNVRWTYPTHFPYRIVYSVNDDLVTIVAVLHAARDDRHWKMRFH